MPLTARLMAQRGRLSDFSAFIGIGLGDTPDMAYTDRVRFTSFCGTGTNRRLAAGGALGILPVHYSDLPAVLARRVDVLLLQVAEHPDGGRFSLSCACDYVETLVRGARVVIAEVNRQAPFTSAEITAADIDVAVRTDRPLPELKRTEPTPAERAIAAHVAALVPDGATLQFGLGAVPDCVADLLSDRRDLGLHTGVLSDGAMGLMKAGAVTNARKPSHRGVTVAGTLLGSRALLDFAHLNAAIAMQPISVTHCLPVLAQLPAFTAINSALEVDLSGQANTETVGRRYVGTIGGALDFLRGARVGRRAAHHSSALDGRGPGPAPQPDRCAALRTRDHRPWRCRHHRDGARHCGSAHTDLGGAGPGVDRHRRSHVPRRLNRRRSPARPVASCALYCSQTPVFTAASTVAA